MSGQSVHEPIPQRLRFVNFKLNWAGDHLQTLYREIRAWKQSNSYILVSEPNEDLTEYSVSLKFHDYPNLTSRWSMLLGDVLFNLRCALDHLVYALAVVETQEDPPPDEGDLAFPITDTEDEFGRKLWKMAGLSDEAIAFIKAAQPHPGRNQALAHLRELHNIDKHRRFHFVTIDTSGSSAQITWPDETPQPTSVNFRTGPLIDQAEILQVSFPEPCPNMDVEFNPALEVALLEGFFEQETPVPMMEILLDIDEEVHRIVKGVRDVVL